MDSDTDRKLCDILYPELLTTQKLSSDCCLTNKYMLWKLKLLFVLKDHNVLHVVETTNPNPGDEEWEHAEDVARYLIVWRIHDSLLHDFVRFETVKSALDHLDSVMITETTILTTFLCREYTNYKMEPGTDINEHVFRMRAMAKLIGFSGVEMPEEVQALALLNSLSDEWEDDVEKVMMDLNSSKDAFTFDNVGKRLRVANEFRSWRKYCSFVRGGATRKGVKEKANASNDDNKTRSNNFSTLTERIYSNLKGSGQLNHTGSDFCKWKSWICSVLRLNHVDYLLKTPDSPPKEDGSSRCKRLSDDFIARHIILGGMSDDLFLTFHDYPTARALMDALEYWFGSPSIAKKMVDFSKFTCCQMPENGDIDKHLSDMDVLVTNLKAAGVDIPDEMEAPRLINSLPSSWSDIRTVLSTRIEFGKNENVEKLKLVDMVKKSIDRLIASGSISKKEESRARSQKHSQVKCFSCGRFGHYKSNCPYY